MWRGPPPSYPRCPSYVDFGAVLSFIFLSILPSVFFLAMSSNVYRYGVPGVDPCMGHLKEGVKTILNIGVYDLYYTILPLNLLKAII